MGHRCKLCRSRLTEPTRDAKCTCGWRLDANCADDHRSWCPDGDQDAWVGAVEL